MIIRNFHQSDVGALSNLMRETIKKSNSPDYPEKTICLLCNLYNPKDLLSDSKRMEIFVAENEHGLIGTVSLDGDRISRMFVKPTRQGIGIGRQLLQHLESIVLNKGIVVLRVRSSITAFGYYRKLGYSKVRKVNDRHIGQVIWMKKHIS